MGRWSFSAVRQSQAAPGRGNELAKPLPPREPRSYPDPMQMTSPPQPQRLITVTGAGGFIGGHLVKRLQDDPTVRVRGVDKKPLSEWFQRFDGCDNIEGNLFDSEIARKAVENASIVFHLAADMGGMGFIAYNDVACLNGAQMDVTVVRAAAEAHVDTIMFASSACVYPLRAQDHGAAALVESDAYPAQPPEGYGWEKLYVERLLSAYSDAGLLGIRLPRLHNVYGPHGAWMGGREKAPAALCRKIAAARRLGIHEIPLWGTGTEIRSYCYVDDAVEGLIQLTMHSGFDTPVNIGSDSATSTVGLAELISEIACWPVRVSLDQDKPAGVPSRNADISLARREIAWEPRTNLRDGLSVVFREIDLKLSQLPRAALAKLAQ